METTSRPVTIISTNDQTMLCTTNLLTTSPLTTPVRLTPTGKISHAKTRVYTQRYRRDWEKMPDFAGWLTSVPCQPTRAFCNYCKKNLHAHRLSLLKHTCTMKHQRATLAHNQEQKKWKTENESLEVGLVEEVETVDDTQISLNEENEEDIEYAIERLDTDDEDTMETSPDIQKEIREGIRKHEEEEEEKDVDNDLCAQLQSDDENSKSVLKRNLCSQLQFDDEDSQPVIKKIKLPEEKCRDPLAEAMAHVHSEYLEEEIEDQENIQMEMVMESANPDMSGLSSSVDDVKDISESSENDKTVHHLEIEKKSIGKVLQEDSKSDLVASTRLPILNTTYQSSTSSTSTHNTINFVPIVPNMKTHKTITLMCGSKAFTLTGGTFQPGTQYVLTKLKGKPATLMMADQKKTIMLTEPDKSKAISLESADLETNQPSVVPSTSQQSIVAEAKRLSSKKIAAGKQSIKSNALKKLRISTYVVDTTKGIPIGGLQVSLYKLLDGKWTFLNESTTNADGHCTDLIEKVNCTAGRYKLHFDVDKYFTLRKIETMFPFVEIVFDAKNPNGHYHMPLLLSPFGYTIHRGT